MSISLHLLGWLTVGTVLGWLLYDTVAHTPKFKSTLKLATKLIGYLLLVIFALLLLIIASIPLSGYVWDQPLDMREVRSIYESHKMEFTSRVDAARSKEEGPKFLILKYLSGLEAGHPEYIVYDESDDIANIRSIHLPFWLARIHLENTQIETSPISAIQLEGHYYWIRVQNNGSGYALRTIDGKNTFIRWNCSVFKEPITEVCPDQLQTDLQGNVTLNHDYVSANLRR